jgi:uncharacterized OB-fold protein
MVDLSMAMLNSQMVNPPKSSQFWVENPIAKAPIHLDQAVIYPAHIDDSNGAEKCGLQVQATLALKPPDLMHAIAWCMVYTPDLMAIE